MFSGSSNQLRPDRGPDRGPSRDRIFVSLPSHRHRTLLRFVCQPVRPARRPGRGRFDDQGQRRPPSVSPNRYDVSIRGARDLRSSGSLPGIWCTSAAEIARRPSFSACDRISRVRGRSRHAPSRRAPLPSPLRCGVFSASMSPDQRPGLLVVLHALVEQGVEEAAEGGVVAPPLGDEDARGAFLDAADQAGAGLGGGDPFEQEVGGEVARCGRRRAGRRRPGPSSCRPSRSRRPRRWRRGARARPGGRGRATRPRPWRPRRGCCRSRWRRRRRRRRRPSGRGGRRSPAAPRGPCARRRAGRLRRRAPIPRRRSSARWRSCAGRCRRWRRRCRGRRSCSTTSATVAIIAPESVTSPARPIARGPIRSAASAPARGRGRGPPPRRRGGAAGAPSRSRSPVPRR